MIYNAEGDILSPIVIHKADVPKGVREFIKNDFHLVETKHGALDYDAVMEVPKHIER